MSSHDIEEMDAKEYVTSTVSRSMFLAYKFPGSLEINKIYSDNHYGGVEKCSGCEDRAECNRPRSGPPRPPPRSAHGVSGRDRVH